MQRTAPTVALALLCATLGACAEIAGLDELHKNDCALGCPDDASPDAPAPLDAMNDGAARDAATADTGPDAADDAAAWDAATRDASVDADAGAPDASVDTGTDAPHEADTGSACTVYLSEPFSNNAHGWTLDSSWGIAATCASPPAPQKGNPDPTADHTQNAQHDEGVLGAYVCGNTPRQTSAYLYATSPAVDVSAAPSLRLTFYRWLNTDSATYMTSTVDVYDGASWVNLYTNPGGAGNLVTDNAWG